MRNNQPVTQQEYRLDRDATLMSTTDTHGKITYANDAFVNASGFSRSQLLGQPHNIVRHPDMPPAAFADMWATLKHNLPWTAIVKNRRQNGDYYWVRANATPVRRKGQTVGYLSVRTTPSEQEVAQAKSLHEELAKGDQANLRLHRGLVFNKGWRNLFTMHKAWRTRTRVALILALVLPLPVLADSLAGLDTQAFITLVVTQFISATVIYLGLKQQLVAPLEQISDEALKLASGEQQSTTHMDRLDEIGTIQRSMGQLGLMFRWVIDDVTSQVNSVHTAIGEIAAGNDNLSMRTEQAAASVQQTVASLASMNDTLKENVNTAHHVNQLSHSASGAASQGGQAVNQVVKTMEDISDSSRRISDIIGVIDGIAFQTNILALNAAVEAARAGEQGRGFAVVAGEVRSLAKRSADAAKEIKQLIQDSGSKVDAGNSLVDAAGKSMDDILQRVRNVSELVSQISDKTGDEVAAIQEIGQAIEEIDRITQQNSALCEQTAAASMSLREQANQLADSVKVFC